MIEPTLSSIPSCFAGQNSAAHRQATRQIGHLLALVRAATADENGRVAAPLIVVNPHPSMELEGIRDILAEERAHFLQLGINGTFYDHLDTTKLFLSPRARVARLWLQGRGYSQDDDMLAAEIGARLITGNWKDLGLKSRAEAAELAVLYTRLLKTHNGDAANEVISAIAGKFPEAKGSLLQPVPQKGRQGDRGGN